MGKREHGLEQNWI